MGSLGSELARKSVHVTMGGFAFLLRYLTPPQAAGCAALALLFNLFLLHRVTRRTLLRDHEREEPFSLGIALYPAAVLALVIVFHDRLELAAAGWGLIAFGDGMATVAGLLLGGPKLPWNQSKSWAGFIAFVLYGSLGSAVLLRWVQLGAVDAGSTGTGPVTWIGLSFLSPDAVGSERTFLIVGCLAAALAAALAESLRTGIDDNILVPLVGGAALYAGSLVEPARLMGSAEMLSRNAGWGLAINAVLAVSAYLVRGVSASGAVWGWFLATVLYAFAGIPGFMMLLAFFVLGTATTRAGYAKKAALGIEQERGGRRGAKHAFANATAGVLFAFLAVGTPYREAFSLALVAAFATAASDTVASEMGQAYGRTPYLVTTFRRVAPGTDGAVSLEGTLAGILASLMMGLLAWGVGLIPAAGTSVIVAAAFFGTTLESILGATVERLKVIDNEAINFTNTVAGGLAAIVLSLLF